MDKLKEMLDSIKLRVEKKFDYEFKIPINLYIDELDFDTMAEYEFEDKCHNIIVNSTSIKHPMNIMLPEAIEHELIHALVMEVFETLDLILYTTSDYSPIFLSCLYWAGLEPNEEEMNNFFSTKLFSKVSKCNTFSEVRVILMEYLLMLTLKLKECINLDDEIILVFGEHEDIRYETYTPFGHIIGVGYMVDEGNIEEKLNIIIEEI